MTTASRPAWRSPRSLLILAGALALSFAASQLGSSATVPNLPWYDGLTKPSFNPPKLAFPIAWTILYALMAVSLWRVAVIGEGAARRRALTAYAVQFALNVAWSFAFFGAQNPALGLDVIVALLAAIVWTLLAFRRIDGLASGLLHPYLAWVAFATALNASILFLN